MPMSATVEVKRAELRALRLVHRAASAWVLMADGYHSTNGRSLFEVLTAERKLKRVVKRTAKKIRN